MTRLKQRGPRTWFSRDGIRKSRSSSWLVCSQGRILDLVSTFCVSHTRNHQGHGNWRRRLPRAAFDDQGWLCRLTTVDASKAKWWASELQKRVIDRCLQLHGGSRYMLEYPVARAFIDSRIQTIYGGTTEIMKEIIGRDLALSEK
jgi:hypothetical protein